MRSAVALLADDSPWFCGNEGVLFEIGSITQSVTGVLLADMCLSGELALDDPVSERSVWLRVLALGDREAV